MEATKGMGRRGLIAGAAALVAGVMAKKAAESNPVEANGGTWTLPYYGINTSDNQNGYGFTMSAQTGSSGKAIEGVGYSLGVRGFGTDIGVAGDSGAGTGVYGTSTNGYAVYGKSLTNNSIYGDCPVSNASAVVGNNTNNGTGVYGASGGGAGVYGSSASSYGVRGTSTSGTAVIGASTSGVGVSATSSSNNAVYGSSSNDTGIYGNTNAATNSGKAGTYGIGNGTGTYGVLGNGYTGGTGVQGQNGIYGVVGMVSNTANTVAVYGNNTSATGSNNIGVYGVSNTGYGVLGVSSAGGVYSGVTGSVFTGSGAAFAGGAQNASAYAAYFTGKVNIDGPFLVNGTQRFTLKHSDGTSRLVASIQSPEPWIEDVGKGTLAGGSATVALDADFREVADTGDYLVFLTPTGATTGLTVTGQRATGFTVRGTGGSGGDGFYWRVMARPKDGGGKIARLAKYEQPNIKIPGINGEPMPPSAPKDAPTPDKGKEAAPPAPPPASPAPAPAPRNTPDTPATAAPAAAPAATSAPAPAAQPTAPPVPLPVGPASPTPQAAPPPRT